MHIVLHRLRPLSLLGNSAVRLTDCPGMTIVVDHRHNASNDGRMDDLQFYGPFNSIKVILREWVDENERLSTTEPRLRLRKQEEQQLCLVFFLIKYISVKIE